MKLKPKSHLDERGAAQGGETYKIDKVCAKEKIKLKITRLETQFAQTRQFYVAETNMVMHNI